MSLINVQNLTFSYEGSKDIIFDDVSFQIDTNWKLGFIGRNGKGKTTFLKLLLGKYEYRGEISTDIFFEYFPYEIPDDTMQVKDVVGYIHPEYREWQLKKELNMLNVKETVFEQPFKTLSSGEKTKILLAAMFLKENSFLLIDEPTDHLDMNARNIVSRYLASKNGFIVVSHDRVFLDDCIDHVLSLNRSNINIQKGNYTSWYENKKKQDEFELAQSIKLGRDIEHLEEASKRTSGWSDKLEKTKYNSTNSGVKPDRGYIGHKSAKLMRRSKVVKARREKAIDEKSTLLKDIDLADNLMITQTKHHSKQLISFSEVSVFYGDNQVCANISFEVRKGDRMAIYGDNGSGKSSILKIIYDQDIKYTGTIIKASGLKISYVPQETGCLFGSLLEFARGNDIDYTLFITILRKLGFSRTQFDVDMSRFSKGQMKKVLIANSLCESANLHVWDEPLNYIDIISRIQIEELLLKYSPTMIFVEHDRAFCDNISNKLLEI